MFIELFESTLLTKTILNQVTKNQSISSRDEFYKSLALMGLVQQGKNVDEKLLNNYVNQGNQIYSCIHLIRYDKNII
jgi:hypothetical protein